MSNNVNSDVTTRGIRVEVFPEYVPEHSDPDKNSFFFKYRIVITNNGDKPVRLLKRHWIIINADGDTEEVEGPGVVGYNPYLKHGEKFEYESFCPLDTSWGTMEGSYLMQDDDGEEFDAEIGRFYLCVPVPA